jgi:hypothetical protein
MAIENPNFRKLILSLGLLGLRPDTSPGIEIGPSVARIDVGRVSPAYRSDLEASAPLPAKVGVTFLGEGSLAVSSMDRSSALHLAAFALDRSDPSLTRQLSFYTHVPYAGLAALPSGDLIVNTGNKIALLDPSLRVKAEASVTEVCGSPKDLDLTKPFIAAVQVASEGNAFFGLRFLETLGRNSDGWACWFSTLDLAHLPITVRGRSQRSVGSRS